MKIQNDACVCIAMLFFCKTILIILCYGTLEVTMVQNPKLAFLCHFAFFKGHFGLFILYAMQLNFRITHKMVLNTST